MKNTRSSTETLNNQLITLFNASIDLVENASIDSLFEKIADLAREQVDATYAAFGVFGEDGKLTKFVTVGVTQQLKERIGHHPEGFGLLGALQVAKKAIRIDDISKDKRFKGFPFAHPEMRSFLGVPILLNDKTAGQIYLADKRDKQGFTDDDEKITELLASYAAIAINNANQYTALKKRDQALRRQNQDLDLLNKIGESLTTTLESDEILSRTLSLVMSHLNHEAGEIFLVDEESSTLEMVLHRGEAAEVFWRGKSFNYGEGIIGMVARSMKPFYTDDLASDGQLVRSRIVLAGFKQMACFPMTAGGRVIGVLSSFSRSNNRISDRDHKVILATCNWAGLAIENARLHQNVKRLAVLEERDRIGMDLHDGIIQEIYGVGLMLEHARMDAFIDPTKTVDNIQTAIKGLNQTMRDLRSYILDLKPRELGKEDMRAGLTRLISEYKANTLSDATLTIEATGLDQLHEKYRIVLFLICQEALANIAKHAKAKLVEVRVWENSKNISMDIRDNGVGFDVDKMNVTIGHGLSNMHTRARNVGGGIDIHSVNGEGTSIRVWVPR